MRRAGRSRRGSTAALGALAIGVAFATVGCSQSAADPSGAPAPSGSAEPVSVVASTSVWGDIAERIGGEFVDVTTLISDPNRDPHEFEPGGRDSLAVARANLIIGNGGGYDVFLDALIDADTRPDGPGAPVVLHAVDLVAELPGIEPDNEHVWFQVDAVSTVASAIADSLSTLDAAHAEDFRAQAREFDADLQPLRAELAELRDTYAGEHIVMTEILPAYLTAEAGLVDVTPPRFAEALEDGNDASPRDLAEVTDLLAASSAAGADSVRAVFVNVQTANSQVNDVIAAAEHAEIPVIRVTELPPQDTSYPAWVGSVVQELRAALSKEGR